MSTNTSPCDGLVGHIRNVCTGEADIKPCLRRRYIRHWLSIGLIPYDPDATSTVHTVWGKVKQVFRFFRALAVHLFTGSKTVPPLVQKLRMSVCKTCPEFNQKSSCGVCGCNLSVKTRWKSSQCPLGKW